MPGRQCQIIILDRGYDEPDTNNVEERVELEHAIMENKSPKLYNCKSSSLFN